LFGISPESEGLPMCQPLGMNCNIPTDICFSFTGFQKRGGVTDIHADGWGIAFFEGRGVRLFLDPQPSAQSPVAELVRNYPIRSLNVIAHIRKATQGIVALENTHPFLRELWGRYWVFAHNGNLPGVQPELDGSFLPVGNTDSERVFCWLLQSLRQRFGDTPPSRDQLQLPAVQRRVADGPLLHRAHLRGAARTVHHGAPQGRGRDGGLQRGDHAQRPRGRDRHAASHRQRNLGGHGAGLPLAIPGWRGRGPPRHATQPG
jgi:hypothetical protein